MITCPCVGTESVEDWVTKRPSKWTPVEREHVRLLVHGGCDVLHQSQLDDVA